MKIDAGVVAVHKYPFKIGDPVRIEMPSIYKPLHVECQNGIPCLWAMVDPDDPLDGFSEFRLFATGQPIPVELDARLEHLGTFQQGPYVWHLFHELDDLDLAE